MALNFPTATFVGQTYSSGGSTWTWDGYAWNANNTYSDLTTSNTVTTNAVYSYSVTTNTITAYTITSTNFLFANGSSVAAAASASSLKFEYDEMFGDGVKNKFDLRYSAVYDTTVTTPAAVLVTINGLVQPSFIENYDKVWQSMTLAANRGYTLTNNTTTASIKFSVTPPAGSIINAKYLGATTAPSVRSIPFKALDILMGY
jgi:hypothetical protein